MISMVISENIDPLKQLVSQLYPQLRFDISEQRSTVGDYQPEISQFEDDDVVFACMYTQLSKKLVGMPEIPGVHWLHEAFFDLDLDANFSEAKKLFNKLHPDKEFLLRPED